jgi:hypothetical protein
LPSNVQVVVFCFKILTSKANRIIEALLFRKKWSISTTNQTISGVMESSDLLGDSNILQTPRNLLFAVDPFLLNDGSIICEVVKKFKGWKPCCSKKWRL